MMHFLRSFRRDENGAVTVDWVVITASVVFLAFSIVLAFETGLVEASEKTSDFTTEMTDEWFGG